MRHFRGGSGGSACATAGVLKCSSIAITLMASPGDRVAEVVEVAQPRLALLGLNRVDDVRDALLDAQACCGAAEIGATQPGAISTSARGSSEWPGGEAAHERVEGRFAGPVLAHSLLGETVGHALQPVHL